MKNLMLMAMLGLGACSWLQKKEDAPAKPPVSKVREAFHVGPNVNPVDGSKCGADGKGGYCDNSPKCHSSAEKCPYKK
jgi:hypothetical protein